MSLHELAAATASFLSDAGGGGEAPTPDSNHIIVVTLIYVVGGGIFTLIGLIVASRAGKRVPVEAPTPAPGPDDDYRQALEDLSDERDRVGVLSLFLGLRGYDTDKIRHGRESDDATRRDRPRRVRPTQ